MKITKKSLEVSGRTLSLEVGRFAHQATSSVLARYGDTTVMAVITMGNEDTKKDYFPLSVEYQERLYAGGRIKGSRWVKREGRATDAETLSGRLIDRTVRPLFPKNFRRDVQLVVMVLSADKDNDPDIVGAIAASAAIAISPLPWNGPTSTVRIGVDENNQVVVNPLNGNQSGVTLDLVVSSTENLIDMIEAGAKQIAESVILEGLKAGFTENQKIIGLIKELVAEVGQTKLALPTVEVPAEVAALVKDRISPSMDAFITQAASHEGNTLSKLIEATADGLEDSQKIYVSGLVEDLLHKTIRSNILEKSHRPDGRKFDEIRPLDAQVGVIPRVHGSAVFQRGQTQALTITTLGAPSLYQSLESAEGEETKRYIHHYNFPPFSTGEVGRMGSPSRREIGHGALAERALLPVIPAEADFPYAIRVVSEIMSSNGSTSMASTCGSTLSLMDAGVPLLAPVAGISIGLVTAPDYQKSNKYVLLTDIIGMEDHHGDMDFKVAGTKTGVTAIQLDVKVPGITLKMCEETFERAKIARGQILEVIHAAIAAPRSDISTLAPRIIRTQIPVEKIGELIGPGGKNIKALMASTTTTIDVKDDGTVFISGTDPDGASRAVAWISGLGKEVIPGEIYEGTVARIQPFGAFVNILPGKDGLVHVSQMDPGFVQDPNQFVSEGQKVKVWVTEIDSQGRINLSMLFDDQGNPAVKVKTEGSRGGDRHAGDPFDAPKRFDRDRGGRGGRRRF